MPVKEETTIGTKDYKAYARRRKVKREEHGERTQRCHDTWAQAGSLIKGYNKGCTLDDEPANRLVNLELDVAEALADFWRMAQQPSQQGGFDASLRWSRKRKRTSRLNKDYIAPSEPKAEPEDALSTAKKNRSSCTFGRDSSTSDMDEIESTQMSKESSLLFDSRAQSPSSPLPSLQLPCGNFLACGSPAAKSAFQRVIPLVPLERPCLLPVKTEIEDMHLEDFPGRPQKVPFRRKSKSCKSTTSKATVKTEPLGEQDIDATDLEAAASPQESGVKSLVSEVHQVARLIVSNKPKSALSEEKEARRLRRIQANRESARQTIRKKQVLCEELTKKASTLALENECMKQKRESLLQELFSLKGQNYHLKQQLEMRSSGNLGPESVEVKMSSDSVNVPALQVSSLPYAGSPVHSFVWAMAAAQAAAANQTYAFTSKEFLDANHAMALQHTHQTSALVMPGMLSSKQACVSRVTEPKSSHTYNDECPVSMGLLQKETGFSTGACAERCTLESEGRARYPNSTMAVAHRGLGVATSVDLPGKSLCEISMHARCSLPQPTAGIPCSAKDTMPCIAVASEGTECFMVPQISQGVGCGYVFSSSRAGYFQNGNTQTNPVMGRNYFAAMAAAEARRRRKELTRNKFSRSRAIRAATIS